MYWSESGRRQLRGLAAGVCVASAVLAAVAVLQPHATRRALLTHAGSKGAKAQTPAGRAQVQTLSEADLYTRTGAAEDIVRAQEAQKTAAHVFEQAVLDETAATRELGVRAQFVPDGGTMTDSRAAAAELTANEAEIKRLGTVVEDAGQTQEEASAVYVTESQKRYTAVAALQDELALEAQADYDIKAAVVGTDSDRFDPTSQGAEAYDPSDPKHSKYHVARITGVDVDGSKSLCGRAEVKHEGTWGTICFKEFTQTDAQVFCKTMGLSGGAARYTDDLGRPTWQQTVITHKDMLAQPAASVIWMNRVKCTGSEANILDCPFGDDPTSDQSWKDYATAHSGCNEAGSVGLCCDVMQFCPPRSYWRPDAIFDTHEDEKFGGMMQPQQTSPEMVSNCKCDAGFYMVDNDVYSGKCTTCPLNACSPIGSTSADDCFCKEGFYKDAATGGCSACPANSCSARGVEAETGIDGCNCFAGYYMSGGACVMCPEAKTSKSGSTSEDQCDMLCGLPESTYVGDHAEAVASAALDAATAFASQRSTAESYIQACSDETNALETMADELTYEPPATLSKENVAAYSNDVTKLQADKNVMTRYGGIITSSGATQVSSTAGYLADGEKLKAAVAVLQQALEDQMHTQHHIKEALTRCQPTVACVPSPCGESEPSNPCEPWPECYPHPCHPWPACSTTLSGGGFPDIESADTVTAGRGDKAAFGNVAPEQTSEHAGAATSAPSVATMAAIAKSPLLYASMAKEQAKSQGQIASAAANIAAVLHSYDVDGGMAKPPLHYFTSDSSAQDTVSEAYANKRHQLEMKILDKIQRHVSGTSSESTLEGTLGSASTLSQTHTRQRGDSYRQMEGMDADKDKLFKLFTH